ncbi:MAG: MTAP family purine nucleoside phosphorylase [Peptococcaceae bacterium]|nr:MTAP family purine nucleoside phosphorylase [Peptococcaceae bacterium]
MDKFFRAEIALIGGSSTNSINFPEDLGLAEISVIEPGRIFETPFGDSPPMKLFSVGETKVITVKMHGWRNGVSRAAASQQLFWILKAAGIKKIIAEGGVGSVNHLLEPRDIVISSDYLDFSMRKDVSLGLPYLLMMRDPVCPEITKTISRIAKSEADSGRIFDRGVYAVTDGRHFESRAEVAMLKNAGADIVGQSMCPEVYLAREIGACYGRLDVVVNYAEGVVRDWDHLELADIYYDYADKIGRLLVKIIDSLADNNECNCSQLRKTTLLK